MTVGVAVATLAALVVAAALAFAAVRLYNDRRKRKERFPWLLALAAIGTAGNIAAAVGEGGKKKGHSHPVNKTTGNKVRVFEHSNFTGVTTDQFDRPGVVHDLWAQGWNDRASAIKVPPRRSVRLWRDTGARGAHLDLPPGNWDLWELGWNDKASSMMTWPAGAKLPPPPLDISSRTPAPPRGTRAPA